MGLRQLLPVVLAGSSIFGGDIGAQERPLPIQRMTRETVTDVLSAPKIAVGSVLLDKRNPQCASRYTITEIRDRGEYAANLETCYNSWTVRKNNPTVVFGRSFLDALTAE